MSERTLLQSTSIICTKLNTVGEGAIGFDYKIIEHKGKMEEAWKLNEEFSLNAGNLHHHLSQMWKLKGTGKSKILRIITFAPSE